MPDPHSPTPRPYIINCANLTTGEEFQQRIWAVDQQEAAALVRREGIAISRMFEEPLALVSLTDDSIASNSGVVGELRLIRADVGHIRQSYIIRHPRSAVAYGILAAMIICTIFWIVLGMFIIVAPLAASLHRQ